MDEMDAVLTKKLSKNFDELYRTFKDTTLKAHEPKTLAQKDYGWRLKNRGIFAWTIMTILIAQNLLIYGLILIAFITGELAQLQLILGILLSGTLVETYFTLNYVVKWLFNDIDYKAMKDF